MVRREQAVLRRLCELRPSGSRGGTSCTLASPPASPPPRAAGLGESRVRDLNDEINKLLREKYHWERQIKALGGADYIASAPRSYDADGRELPGQRGYRYFGAAKDLPGVKELFDSGAQEEASQRSRAAIMRDITPDYYGYRDDDDGVLAAAEAAAERDALVAAREEWDASVAARAAQRADRGAAAGGSADDADDDEGLSLSAAEALAFADTAFRAHVPVPTQADIERALLARKKELLQASLAARYGAGGASSGSAAEGGTV